MRHVIFRIADRMIVGIYATQALAIAARPGFGSVALFTRVSVAAANVPDAAEPGWFITLGNVVQRQPVVLNPKAIAQAMSADFVKRILEPLIEPALPKRERWVREAGVTDALFAANPPSDAVKRLKSFDQWLGNAVLVPDVSFGALYAMTANDTLATVTAQVAACVADAAYTFSELSVGGVNIVEFWYANASIGFFNFPLGNAYRTGRGAQLGQVGALYKAVAVPAGWNETVGFNNMRSRSLGL